MKAVVDICQEYHEANDLLYSKLISIIKNIENGMLSPADLEECKKIILGNSELFSGVIEKLDTVKKLYFVTNE